MPEKTVTVKVYPRGVEYTVTSVTAPATVTTEVCNRVAIDFYFNLNRPLHRDLTSEEVAGIFAALGAGHTVSGVHEEQTIFPPRRKGMKVLIYRVVVHSPTPTTGEVTVRWTRSRFRLR